VSDAVCRKKPLEVRSNILTYSYYALLLTRTIGHAPDRLFYSAFSTERNFSQKIHLSALLSTSTCVLMLSGIGCRNTWSSGKVLDSYFIKRFSS
jgi:hypothetical protein